LALDFANTVNERTTSAPIERLTSYDDFIEFSRQTEIVSDAEAKALLAKAKKNGEEAANVHRRAVRLRDALYAVFEAVAEGRRPSEKDLAIFNEHLAHLRLTSDLTWCYQGGCRELDGPLCDIVRAALELLEPDRRARVGVCGNDTCRFLFFDVTKNRTRRWCEMKTCGNREKARRFRQHSSH
jgi:predicted RNA-binding Zn ribbon-like protein